MNDIFAVQSSSIGDIYNKLNVYNSVLNLYITHDNDYLCNCLGMEIKISDNRFTAELYNNTLLTLISRDFRILIPICHLSNQSYDLCRNSKVLHAVVTLKRICN